MRKKYDTEFKKKAIELSYARGNASEIAEELGIDRVLLYRWRKEFKKYELNRKCWDNAVAESFFKTIKVE